MFLKVEYDLLRCEGYNTAQKLLLAYFNGLANAGRAFWGSATYLASLFGTSTAKMEQILWDMQDKKLIKQTAEGYVLAMKWNDILKNGRPNSNYDD